MSDKMVVDKTKEELQEANYRLNRLFTKLNVSTSGDDDWRYEDACREVGRLQGIEQGLQYIRSLKE